MVSQGRCNFNLKTCYLKIRFKMMVHVELFGIPRSRAGCARVSIETSNDEVRLGDVILDLGARYPALAEECFHGNRLRDGYVANLQGDRFVTESDTTLHSGDCLLIMSADSGG